MCFLVSPQQKRLKYLRLLEMFNKYEKDGSGYLSNNELIEIFRLRGYNVEDPLVIGCIHVREQIHREDFLYLFPQRHRLMLLVLIRMETSVSVKSLYVQILSTA